MAALKPELTGATGWSQPPQTRTIATHRWASLGLFPYCCPLCTIVQMRNLTKKCSLRRDLNRGSLVLKATTTASHHTNSFFLLTQINGMPDLGDLFSESHETTKRRNPDGQALVNRNFFLETDFEEIEPKFKRLRFFVRSRDQLRPPSRRRPIRQIPAAGPLLGRIQLPI